MTEDEPKYRALYEADLRPPQPRKVALMRRIATPNAGAKENCAAGAAIRFEDLATRVRRLTVETEIFTKKKRRKGSDNREADAPLWERPCLLIRRDENGAELWTTRHGSVREAFWNVEFEFDLAVKQWRPIVANDQTEGGVREGEEQPPPPEQAAALPFSVKAAEDVE